MSPTWMRAEEVLWREVVDGVLLLAPGEQEPVVLSGSGVLVWERLAEPATGKVLAAWLADAYGQPPDTILEDLLPALADLEDRGLVRSHP